MCHFDINPLRSLQPLFGRSALNFAPLVNGKLLIKTWSFDKKLSHALAITGS